MPADYKCCCSKENLENWKEKPLHRQFLCDAVDSEFSMEMAFNKQSQKETEGFIFACQKQAIPTNLIKVRIFQQPGSIYCHLCGSQQETIDHLLTSCSVIAHHLLLASKPPLLASSQWTNMAMVSCHLLQKDWEHCPSPVLCIDSMKLLWDFTIQTDRQLRHNRPDIVCINLRWIIASCLTLLYQETAEFYKRFLKTL